MKIGDRVRVCGTYKHDAIGTITSCIPGAGWPWGVKLDGYGEHKFAFSEHELLPHEDKPAKTEASIEMAQAQELFHEALSKAVNGEVRVTSETGGQKGQKPVQFHRLPKSISHVAAHFTKGSLKYPDLEDHRANWELGYDFSLSFDALCRHLFAWWHGEDIDPETGSHHLDAVSFHALVLRDFVDRGYDQFDDRPQA